MLVIQLVSKFLEFGQAIPLFENLSCVKRFLPYFRKTRVNKMRNVVELGCQGSWEIGKLPNLGTCQALAAAIFLFQAFFEVLSASEGGFLLQPIDSGGFHLFVVLIGFVVSLRVSASRTLCQ